MTDRTCYSWLDFLLFLVLLAGFVGLLVLPVSAAEDITMLPPVTAKYELPPCESNLYRWTGETFACQPVDRAGLLQTQRDVNFLGYQACKAELKFVNAQRVRDVKHAAAREQCKKSGKIFDAEKVECAGALPHEEGKQK